MVKKLAIIREIFKGDHNAAAARKQGRLINIFVMDFEFVYIYRHISRKWVFLVDSKCQNTVNLTGLTYTSSRKVLHDGCAKRGTFPPNIE